MSKWYNCGHGTAHMLGLSGALDFYRLRTIDGTAVKTSREVYDMIKKTDISPDCRKPDMLLREITSWQICTV